jgi:hypothetical protein
LTKHFVCLACVFFATIFCRAQPLVLKGQEVEVPGVIIYGDSVSDVRFIIVTVRGGYSFEDLQDKVRYLDKNGKKKKLRPDQADEIRFRWDDQDIRMLSRTPIHHSRKKKFMHIYLDGRVRIYEYIKTYRFTGRQGMSYARINTAIYGYFERPGEKMIVPKAIGFRKQMKNYFKDCEELVNRIKGKVYSRRDMEDIAKFYNSRCPEN